MTDQVPLVAPTTEDNEQVPPQRYGSSEIVTAAAEMNFQHKKSIEKKDAAGDAPDGEGDDAEGKYVETIHNCQTLEKDVVAELFHTDLVKGVESGGKTKTVSDLRTIFGFNELTPKYQHPWYIKLLLSIFSGEFNILLWFGSLLCFIAYGVEPTDPTYLYLGIVLAVVVTITGIFGYFQESKSSDITASFASFAVEMVPVIRSGANKTVEPRELVPGDLIALKAGDMIPADIRITECSSDAEVNNSSLTGESDPIERAWVPEENPPLEAKNMAFFGTHLMKGNVKGIVVATGDCSFMGTVASLAKETANVETPIALEIRDFVHKVSAIAGILGITFFIFGIMRDGDLMKNVVFLIGIIVANVPEGLLATVTVSLTLTATRMAHKNVQVKNLESVETLGSTSVICSDKTGTLTTSIMTVKHVMFDLNKVEAHTSNPIMECGGKGTLYDFVGNFPNVKQSLNRLLRIGLLCNNANMTVNDTTGEKKIVGDATESAVYKFCDAHVGRQWMNEDSQYRDELRAKNPAIASTMSSTAIYRAQHPQLHEIPFNSANKWQVSVHRQDYGKYNVGDQQGDEFETRAIVVLKGAPEKVLDMCDTYLEDGKEVPMTREIQARIVQINEELAKEGERVLGFADLELDEKEYDISLEEPMMVPEDGSMGAIEEPGVLVRYNDQMYTVPLHNTYTAGEREGQVKDVADHTFRELYNALAEILEMKSGSLRIIFTESEWCPYEVKLKDLKVQYTGDQASILGAYEGPYNFCGTSRKDANWPFGRADEKGLCFVGFYAMIDPHRASVPGAVLKCKEAGIKVIMVTGDHPTTANAIAKQVNIVGKYDPDFNWSRWSHPEQEYHMTKQDIAEMDRCKLDEVDKDDPRYKCALVPGQKSKHTIPGWTLQEKEIEGDKHPEKFIQFWNEVLTKESVVFARTSPEQKLRIVEACQLRGGIVAVTGDGVNDSPALKKADIGVAMGITGTDVAKETADMILKDDNFASIVNGVEEGRIIFDNLKKSIAYTLSSNIPEIAPFIFYQLILIPLPLSTVMILLVDLGTDLAPAISLAHEDSELDIMERPPRNQDSDKLVTLRLISFSYLQIGCIQALAGFYAYFVVLWSYGLRPEFLLGLEENSLFEWKAIEFNDGENQLDGYWLYCWSDTTAPCLYAPDPSSFNCHWDDDTWDADAALAMPKTDAAVKGKCPKPKNTSSDMEFFPFGEWYNRDEVWTNDFIDKVTEIYEDVVLASPMTHAMVCSTPGTPVAQACAKKGECQKEMLQGCADTAGCHAAMYDTSIGETGSFSLYTDASCQMESSKLAATQKGFMFPETTGDYRRSPREYLPFYTAWKGGFKNCGADNDDCTERSLYQSYTVALYELVPFKTYVTEQYKERDCWSKAAEGYPMGTGAQHYYTNFDSSLEEEGCLAFDGPETWRYWDARNRDCTMIAPCLDDNQEMGGHTLSTEDTVYRTLFPLSMTDRDYALRQSNTAYFISIIVVQWADLMICKTRVRSLFEQGMTNVFMNYSLFFETALGAMLVYLPVANIVTETAPLKFVWWTSAIPFSVLIYTYDELRKGYIRAARATGAGSWLEKNTYW